MRNILLLCEEPLPQFPEDFDRARVVIVMLTPGQGGAWTEVKGELELIRFGIPQRPTYKWLNPLANQGMEVHDCASQAIEWMVAARGLNQVVVADAGLEALARRGLRSHGSVPLHVCGTRDELTNNDFWNLN